MASTPQRLDPSSSLWDLVERRAEASPEGIVFVDGRGRSLSFVGWLQHAQRVAAGLFQGLAPERIPERLDIFEELPRNSMGKLLLAPRVSRSAASTFTSAT
jgi:non-ribosomal peptide synthetase component E (peptide arylation enzyme)